MTNIVVRTERGWAGHFICADRCLFRRNTLLECGDTRIVVSTVGLLRRLEGGGFRTTDGTHYFETMAFHAKESDIRYHDADVSRQVQFESARGIDELDADDRANTMHETVVQEISNRLQGGDLFETTPQEEW